MGRISDADKDDEIRNPDPEIWKITIRQFEKSQSGSDFRENHIPDQDPTFGKNKSGFTIRIKVKSIVRNIWTIHIEPNTFNRKKCK